MTTPDDVLLETAQGRSLHIVEDMQFQRWSWAIERVAWGSMVLVVLLALAGALRGWTSEHGHDFRPGQLGAGPLRALCPCQRTVRSAVSSLPLGRSLPPPRSKLAAPCRVPSRSTGCSPRHRASAPARTAVSILDFEVTEPGRPAFVEIFLTREPCRVRRRRHRLARTTGSSLHPVRLSLREGCHHGRRTPRHRNVSFAPHCVPRLRVGACSPSSPPSISCFC